MKQIKTWLATIAVLLCSIAINAAVVDSGVMSFSDITWALNTDGTLTIGGMGAMPNHSTMTPPPYFKHRTSITAVSIESTVTSIGSAAFYQCSELSSITIPQNVTSIGKDAFKGCSKLDAISILNEEISIGENAFDGTSWYDKQPAGVVYKDKILYNYKGAMPESTNLTVENGTTRISSYAFKNCKTLSTIEIPQTVTFIGEGAFYGCSGLTNINIPENMTSIGNYMFQSCSSLFSITIPQCVTSIGDCAFMDCSNLSTIIIPNSVISINNSVFSDCTSLKSVIFEDGGEILSLGHETTESLGEKRGLFSNCPIESVYLGRTLQVGTSPFNGASLSSAIIGNDVTSIGNKTFQGCLGITSIIIPEGVLEIGDEAFSSCNNLTSIQIPKGVTKIGSGAFQECSNLISVEIPEGVISMGEFAFFKCTELSSITIPEGLVSLGRYAFSDCSSLVYTIIPKSVTTIGEGAFYGCSGELVVNCDIISTNAFANSNFSKVIIGEGVTSISSNAFENCDNLISITFPSTITDVGDLGYINIKKAFWKCSTLPNGYYGVNGAINYTANSDYASYSGFKVYPMLGSMFEVDGITYVPTSISERTCDIVDYDCNRTATSVNVGRTVTYEDVEFTVNNVNDYTFYGNQYLEEVTFANQGSIGAYALAGCSELVTVNIAEGVTAIGDYAFDGCNKLSSFALPASATSVGKTLFNGCNGLMAITVAEGNVRYDSRNNCNAIVETETNKLVVAFNETIIPASVTAIGDYAFSGCGEMASVTIHKDILSIGDYAFMGCSSLANVVIEDRTEVLILGSNGNEAMFSDCPLNSVYVGGKISYNTDSNHGYSPFSNNTSLCTVNITDKEETIYPYEFYNCSALEKVTVGDGVTSIGEYAFSGCSSLERFAFGSSMKTIGTKAFLGCSKMTKVESSAVNPPVCGDNALDDLDKWSCTLYMPVGYKAAYQAADQWKEFVNMEDNITIKLYTLTYMVDGNVYHTEQLAYNQTIVLPDAPQKEGYGFDGWIGLPETMPVSDITVHASFTINEYTLTYKVDDVEYKTESVPYGTKIIALAAPTKEGHSFSGWSEFPETMPAKDVTITGSFSVNKYLLTYIIDSSTYQSYPVAYGTAITMPDAPAKLGYSFDGWDKTLTVMPAEDVVVYGSYTRLPIENFIITDGGEVQFSLEEDLQCNAITYTRNFTNTYWQSLYVPFEIPVTEELLAEFEIADLNDIRQYDRDDDGVKDETVVEAFKVKSGATLAANYPYLIRAKVAGEKTITVTDATLFATEEVSIDCSSIHEKYTFTGTYSTMESSELTGCYALCDGVWQPIAEDATLGAFRVYLKIESRDNNTTPAQAIRVRVIGEDEEDGATAIDVMESTDNSQQSTVIYDLMGRRVANSDKGIYIVNGRKVVVK